MLLETKHLYEFENFVLNPVEQILLRDGKLISITPKVFETLCALIENAGHLIEKGELMRKIWKEQFVEDSNLTFNIKMLRKALGDDAANPRFIETVPRRGYRFIAEVREIPVKEPDSAATASTIAQRIPARKIYLPLVALIVIAGGLIVAGSWWNHNIFSATKLNAPILSQPFHSEKFSSDGRVSQSVLSPDGKVVAYVDGTDSRWGVWLRRLETSDNVSLVPQSDVYYGGLAFAHDGQSLFFMRQEQDKSSPSAIYRVSIFGGVPAKIVEKTEGWFSLSPDDKQISFVRCERKNDDFCSLLTVDTDGRNERKLLTAPHPIRIADNQFSPDGKRIAFSIGQSWNGATDIHLRQINLETGEQSEISSKAFFNIRNLKWLPDGSGLLLCAMETLDGVIKIWQVSIKDDKARPLTNDSADYLQISLNRDADKLIATQSSNDFHLSLLTNSETKNLTTARNLAFTPDGKVVFDTADGNIWIINRDGNEKRQLTNDPAKDFKPRVSPDGRYIFFTSNRSGANQIWRMDSDGSNQIQITSKEGGYPRFISPDDKWIYYESGLHQTLWRVSAEGGEETQIAENKLYEPRISPDGSLVAYFLADQKNINRFKIAVLSIADKKIIKMFNFDSDELSVSGIVWLKDNRTLNFITTKDAKFFLWKQSLAEDERHLIATLGEDSINDFALSDDGKTFGFIRGRWLFDAVLIDGLK